MKLETRKLAAEALGTFLLVFFGCGAIVVDAATRSLGHAGVSIAWGLAVLVLIHALGEVSGAHLNPAVTAAFAAAGRFPARSVAPYCAAQVAGALGGAFALRGMFPGDRFLGATLPYASLAQTFGFEFLMTFLLMLVIMAVSSGSREQGMMAGLAVGAAVALDAFVGGPVTGASMNPARSIGPALVSGETRGLWLYCAAPLAGAVSGALTWRLLRDSPRPSGPARASATV